MGCARKHLISSSSNKPQRYNRTTMDYPGYDSSEPQILSQKPRPNNDRNVITATDRKSRLYKTYHYEPLSRGRGAIRLLELFSSERPDAAILCALTEAETSRYPYYEALSWCWGPPTQTDHIKIHRKGKTYHKPVSTNLVPALKALRYSHRSRFLWIDMVCIDQDKYIFGTI